MAQRFKAKPDNELEMKILKMKILRNQTYKDLHAYVTKREKIPWRNWDKFKPLDSKGFDRHDY